MTQGAKNLRATVKTLWFRWGRSIIGWALAVAALVLFSLTLRQMYLITVLGESLKTGPAPRGIVSLQVACDMNEAARIVRSWIGANEGKGVLGNATQSLDDDELLLLLYSLTFLATGLLILHCLRLRGKRLGLALLALVAVTAAAGLCDHWENGQLETLLTGTDPRDWTASDKGAAIARAFLFAQCKWICIVLLVLGLAVGGGAALRLWRLRKRQASRWEDLEHGDFRGLCASEGLDAEQVVTGPSGEPWLGFAREDKVGLALSGGGIRSATFNLGLLQGLHSKGLLPIFHYLATVSGGGYIGGWWTVWRSRPGRTDQDEFPTGKDGQEAEEVRHLREFSNFLAPRWGFFESEMWNAFVAVLGGMVPALVLAFSLVSITLMAWLFLAFHVVWRSLLVPPLLLFIVTGLVLFFAERAWEVRGKAEPDPRVARTYWWWASLSTAGVAGLWFAWYRLVGHTGMFVAGGAERPLWCSGRWMSLDDDGPLAAWWHAIGARPDLPGFHVYPRLFDPSIVWLAAVLLLVVARLAGANRGDVERQRAFVSGIDRVVQRLLALGVAWALFGLVWLAGANLHSFEYGELIAGGGAAGSAGLFAWLRNWIGSRASESKKSGITEMMRQYIPVVLAHVALILTGALVAHALLQWLGDSWWAWFLTSAGMLAILGAGLFLDMTEVGLHAFYRDRIIRAYLGASNPNGRSAARSNRHTEPRAGDDMPLTDVGEGPLHLVCCAANDLSGDHLANLSRGSRSAVLSRHGLAIGDHWAGQPDLRMGSALTASAAAFNSNMGSVSMNYGPPVAFLMSALNLRLGLWLRHPACESRAPRLLPGLLFLREMLGQTTSGTREGKPISNDVHLSDGAHFENLALYELVRRHCRYILVSDCGEDPDVAFDDFGNAARRIREDFGVEVEIDLSPLKPDDKGISRQHLAVGTIHYDTPRGSDKGILLYFKPSLTGDEPRDVLQYRERNGLFPHETTGDQFYDEAQWESYRRLGEHAAHSGLRFVERRVDGGAGVSPDDLFIGARREWYPTPPDLNTKVLELTQRYTDLETEIMEKASPEFAREIFPEINILYSPDSALRHAWEAQRTTVHLLMKMIQLMEDVWLGCLLDTHYNHPLNLGWINLFQRWAWTPTFRVWWPFLAPMFGSGFLRFAREQFGLGGEGPSSPREPLRCLPAAPTGGLALEWWGRMGYEVPGPDSHFFSYNITLTTPRGEEIDVQAGIVVVKIEGDTATWTSNDFFVPPSLWGTGIGGRFLRKLVGHLGQSDELHGGLKKCHVTLEPRLGPDRTDLGSRQELVDLTEFYKGAGFTPVKPSEKGQSVEIDLLDIA